MSVIQLPVFRAIYPDIAPAVDKYMAILWNGTESRKIIIHAAWAQDLNIDTAVDAITLRQKVLRITDPGTGGTDVTPVPFDTSVPLPEDILASYGASSVTEDVLLQDIVRSGGQLNLTGAPILQGMTAFNNAGEFFRRMVEGAGLVCNPGEGVAIKNITSSTIGTISYFFDFTVELI